MGRRPEEVRDRRKPSVASIVSSSCSIFKWLEKPFFVGVKCKG